MGCTWLTCSQCKKDFLVPDTEVLGIHPDDDTFKIIVCYRCPPPPTMPPRPIPPLTDGEWEVCMECGEEFLRVSYEFEGEIIKGSRHLCPPCYAMHCMTVDEMLALAENEVD